MLPYQPAAPKPGANVVVVAPFEVVVTIAATKSGPRGHGRDCCDL
jgi:hypothetical protein